LSKGVRLLSEEILDSGSRRTFDTGAVRDEVAGKGRCDLLPLTVVGRIIGTNVLDCVELYVRCGKVKYLEIAIARFVSEHNTWNATTTAMLEAAMQYENGCAKYGDRNWEKGMPIHCFIDSGVRHLLKYKRGDNDEPHDKAFIWNILCAIWMHENKPELLDLPFIEKEDNQSCQNT
jgi:hypothetical protein